MSSIWELENIFRNDFESNIVVIRRTHHQIVSGTYDDLDPFFKKLYELFLSASDRVVRSFLGQVTDSRFHSNVQSLKVFQDFMFSAFLEGSKVSWNWRKFKKGNFQEMTRGHIDVREMFEECEPFHTEFESVALCHVNNNGIESITSKDAYQALELLIQSEQSIMKEIQEQEKLQA